MSYTADFETDQLKQQARPLPLQLAQPSSMPVAGLGHTLAAAKLLELAQRASFGMP